MANPRKFSEKIALQKQKQAEGTAEFEKIMSEVKATRVIENTLGNADIADGNVLHRNANLSGGSGTSSGASGGGASPDANVGGGISIGGNNGAGSVNSTSGSPTAYRESRGRSVGVGPMRRPSERKQDRSPYGSAASGLILSGIPQQTQNSYLSPPIDSSWRRSNSDSALHQTLNNLVDGSFITTSPAPNAMSDLNSLHANYHQHSQHSQRSQSPNIGRSYSPQAQRRRNTLLQQQIHHEQQQQMQHQRLQIQQQQQAQQELQQHLQNQQRIMQQQQNLLHQQQQQQQQQQYANAKYNNSNIIFKPLHEQQLSFNNTGSLPDLTSVHYTTTNQTTNNTQMNATQQQQTLSPILSPHQNNGCHDRDQTSSPFSPPSTAGGGGPPSPYRQQQNSPTSATKTPSANVQTSPHLSFTNLSVQSPAQNTAAAFSTLPTLGAASSTGNLTDYRQPANPPSPGSSPGLLTSGPNNDLHTSAPSSPIRHCQANLNTSVTGGGSTQSHQPQMTTQSMQNSFGNIESNTAYNTLNPAFHNHFEQFHLGDNSQSPQNNYESLEFDDLGMVNHNNYHSKIIDFGDMTSSSSTANSSNTTRTNPTNSTSNCTNNNNLTQQQRNNTQQYQHHNRQQQLLNNNATSTTSVNANTNGPSNSCNTHGLMNNNDRQQDIISGNSSPIHCVPSPSSPLPIPISAHSPSHHHNHHHHNQQQQQQQPQQQQLSLSVQTSPHHSPHHSPSPLSVSSPGLTMLPSIPSPSPQIIQQQQQNQHNHINNQRANQLHHNQASHNNHHQQQQQQNQTHTPTTATNIPQIIFSDYSSSRDIFDSLDLDLGTIDGAGLQMLSDQNPIMIADPSIEDSFRRDLN